MWGGAAFLAILGSVISGDGGQFDLAGISLGVGGAAVGGVLIGLIAGYVGWYFTRFVIDGTELRITRGVLTKQSRRIPYERIQSVDVAEPLVARILGLAELRIDMAGGSESTTVLRYLLLDEVRQLRRLLLARAHGETVAADGPAIEERSLITKVPTERIVLGTLMSLDFVGAVLAAIAAVISALVFDQAVLAFGLLPTGAAIAQIIAKRVIEQWDFTLSRGDRGLRIERGLLSRTSQTIPYDRVQGIAIKEPLVWRRFGWQRLEVDVAGYASRSSDDTSVSISTLLPISDPHLAEALIAELVPSRTEVITTDRPTERSWPFAPIGWRYRWIEVRQGVVVSRRGWIERVTCLVPHMKSQSVEIRQGPLQRWRGVATVEVHTPPGPVDVDGSHLDAAEARRLWTEQLSRI